VSNQLKMTYLDPLIESSQLVIVWVRFAEGGGGGAPGGSVFLGEVSKFFLDTSTEFQIYRRIPELKPSRFAPFLSKLG
jgi:hypothetical protein